MSEELVTIARFSFSYQAEILAGKLEAEGIHSRISGADSAITGSFITSSIGGIRLEVFASDVEEALRIMNTMQQDPINTEIEGRVIEINRTRYDEVPGKCVFCNTESVFCAREKQHLDEYDEVVNKTLHIPVPLGNNYFCLSCNQTWKV